MLTEENIRAAITNTVMNLDVAQLAIDADFTAAGLDSLDISSLLLELQEQHGLVVPDEDIEKCSSIRAILDYA